MNVLILGSGGREHAIAWKVRQSDLCSELFIAPGNPGTAEEGTNINIDYNDFEEVKNTILHFGIDLLIVGPEEPLVNGIKDFLVANEACKNLLIIGPDKMGAQIEGSKAWAKEFMLENNIPTAPYAEFNESTLEDGFNYLDTVSTPIVLKADGLAAGKGVVITEDRNEAKRVYLSMMKGQFGEAGKKIVIEAFLTGIEFSVFALTDGHDYVLLPEAKDYKRIGENDTGLNTGGMGAISPVPIFDLEMKHKVIDRIINPTITGLLKRQIDYRGFLFFGLIEVNGEPFVIEYNCRMGDPETEVVMPRIHSDFLSLLVKAAKQEIEGEFCTFNEETFATVMLVSGGYPGSYEKGKKITGIKKIKKSKVFHAGTIEKDKKLETNGGRVLAITSSSDSIEKAVAMSLDAAQVIEFEGKTFRRDIGRDLIKFQKRKV